jgi:dTDP-4-dehydrorhamnose reductase
MLGASMVPTLAAAGHLVYPTDLRAPSLPVGESKDYACGSAVPLARLDVREAGDVAAWIRATRPELVVHLAAETDVDICESRPEHAYATNATGTQIVARACAAAGAPIAYVSTAGVFDGKKTDPYTEDDPAYPINVYGASKLAGERYVQELTPRSYIVRAGWMVGGGDRDHKFVAKILQQLDAGARTLFAVDDKWGTPTYAPDFSKCFASLIQTQKFGLYHMACLGSGTRYDVARQILQVLGRDDVELRAVGSDFFAESYPAPRPKSEMMLNEHLNALGLNTMRPWQESLDEYLRTAIASLMGVPAPAGSGRAVGALVETV